MKIKKNYSFTNKRTIWRLIPSEDKLVIEERDGNDKQVYFNCLDIQTGKELLKNYQLDEKFWVGIEAFEKDKIFFHGFIQPDMPGHSGIYAFDLKSKKIIWSKENPVFLFLYNGMVFAFNQKFESREIYSFDAETGNLIKEYGEDVQEVNELREKVLDAQYEKFQNYHFPETYSPGILSPESEKLVENWRATSVITGPIDYVQYKECLMFAYHTVKDDGHLDNNFTIIEIGTEKVIFEEVLNAGITSYIPDSFFVKDNLLFLLKDKMILNVYSLVYD